MKIILIMVLPVLVNHYLPKLLDWIDKLAINHIPRTHNHRRRPR
jgi:hypothetical protein